jgi:23S rRNA (pseudouridine1915-N3)-methyltransferase
MQIKIISIGTKMPAFVTAGITEYQKRLPKDYRVILHEINAIKRGKNADTDKILSLEAEKIQAAIKPQEHIIMLDRLGKSINTHDLAHVMKKHHDLSQDIALVIGGPEGIAPELLAKAHTTWSLSALTFPHPLVRIILTEQIYRAYSIITGHPYHR